MVKKGLDIRTSLISGEIYLTTALKLGNQDVASFIIKKEVFVQQKNRLNETPLQIAFQNKMVKPIILLIEKGANFDFKEDNLLSILFELEETEEAEHIDALLKTSNNMNFTIKERVNLIYESLNRSQKILT